jgi:hypothetical protein
MGYNTVQSVGNHLKFWRKKSFNKGKSDKYVEKHECKLKRDVIGNQYGIKIIQGGFHLQLHASQKDPASGYNEVLNEQMDILQIEALKINFITQYFEFHANIYVKDEEIFALK